MFARFAPLFVFLTVAAAGVSADAQIRTTDPFPDRGRTTPEVTQNVIDSLAKKRIEEEKKEHEELLERGNEALKLFVSIEASYQETSRLSGKDRERLEQFEKIVRKIRKDLGGDSDDDKPEERFEKEVGPGADVAETVKYLMESTEKLVDEIKKTTRYSISAVAIETSNSVIKIARFLRLKK